MRRTAFLFFLLLVFSDCYGQLITLPEGKSFESESKFNPIFIAANNISEIEILDELKPDGEKIIPTGRKVIYKFNVEGRTVSIQEITKSRDTLLTIFEYTEGRLSCEVKNDASGLFSYCHTYDKTERPYSLKYSRLGKKRQENQSTQISTETFEHKVYDTQLHSTQFNTSGRPYRKEIRYYDADGYFLKYVSDFVMTSRREEEKYSYNDHGLLSEKDIKRPNEEFSRHYEYDEVGNLLAEELHKGGAKVERREYVYRGEDMLLQAELTRDEIKQAIRIQSYTYRFR
ncbi:MAG: hypothetical protein ACJAQ4_002580 [Cryomorphaceae bacterium]